jgi:hypothetical protein
LFHFFSVFGALALTCVQVLLCSLTHTLWHIQELLQRL